MGAHPMHATTPAARRLLARLPRRTVRFRLTLLYGGLLLLAGAAVLALTYLLVAHSTEPRAIVENIGGTPRITTANGDVATLVPSSVSSQMRQLQHQAAHQHAADLHQLLVQSGIALGAATLLAFAVGWFVAGRVLRPLRAMTSAARHISQHNLHQRLAITGPDDEVKELADTIDGLLGRLDTAFDAQRRFIANVSHELRTPLTWERALAEVSLADPDATATTLRSTIEELIASGQDQERLIEALLTLATSERGLERRDPVELAALTRECLKQRQDQVPADLDLQVDLGEAWTTGNRDLLKRLIANLLDNAVRYNRDGGRLAVSTRTGRKRAVLTVSNTGPVIQAGEIGRLLRPFERLTGERTGHPGGQGLGLSIVAAIATAHGADLRIKPLPAGDLEVAVTLPLIGRSTPSRRLTTLTARGRMAARPATGRGACTTPHRRDKNWPAHPERRIGRSAPLSRSASGRLILIFGCGGSRFPACRACMSRPVRLYTLGSPLGDLVYKPPVL